MGAGRHEEHARGGKEQQGVIFAQVLTELLQVVGRQENRERGPQQDDHVKVEGKVVEVHHAGKIGTRVAPQAVRLPGGHGQGGQRDYREDALLALGRKGVHQQDEDGRKGQGNPGTDARQVENGCGDGHLASPLTRWDTVRFSPVPSLALAILATNWAVVASVFFRNVLG